MAERWAATSSDFKIFRKFDHSNIVSKRHKTPFRTSDGGNRSHNASLPIILKKIKVGQILQYSCISLLLVPILLYWVQVSVSINVLLYFGAEMATFCIKHIEKRKNIFLTLFPPPGPNKSFCR